MTTTAEAITAPTTGEFKIEHEFTPRGDQPHAIDQIVEGVADRGSEASDVARCNGFGEDLHDGEHC